MLLLQSNRNRLALRPYRKIRSYEFVREYTGCRCSLHGVKGIRSYEFPSPLDKVLPSPL